MHRIRGKLTYANVMATIAVFIALGGASYAAVKLPKNSVGAKQIKNGAITGAKIKNGAITGAKIATSTLGVVPSASHADSADSAGTAKTASQAASATIADEAKALGGLTTAQIESAAKLTCPTGTFMVANTCVEEASRTAARWPVATETCEKAGRLLPSPAQLVAYDIAKNNSSFEWTDSIYYYPTTSEYEAVTIEETSSGLVGVGSEGIFGSGTRSYRCLVPAGN